MREIPAFLTPFLKKVEGVKLHAYADGGGVVTIGVGHTEPGLTLNMVWTPEQVDAGVDADARRARAALIGKVGEEAITPLSDHQFAAVLSFVFNLGVGDSRKPMWGVWKALKAGNLDAVLTEMGRFTKERVNGAMIEVRGLVARRAAERALWSTGDVQASAAIGAAMPCELPSGYLRCADTPPSAAAVKPLGASKTFIANAAASATTIAAFAAPAVQGVADKLAPAAEVNHTFAAARNTLLCVAAVLGAVGIGCALLKQRRAVAT